MQTEPVPCCALWSHVSSSLTSFIHWVKHTALANFFPVWERIFQWYRKRPGCGCQKPRLIVSSLRYFLLRAYLTYSGPGTVFSAVWTLSHLIFLITWWGRCYRFISRWGNWASIYSHNLPNRVIGKWHYRDWKPSLLDSTFHILQNFPAFGIWNLILLLPGTVQPLAACCFLSCQIGSSNTTLQVILWGFG